MLGPNNYSYPTRTVFIYELLELLGVERDRIVFIHEKVRTLSYSCARVLFASLSIGVDYLFLCSYLAGMPNATKMPLLVDASGAEQRQLVFSYNAD